jgi:2-keto-4-pentenoate hydratase
VLPGAVHKMVPVNPGDVFRAEFAHLGAVTVRFSNGSDDRGHHRPGDRRHLITSERERKGIAQFSDEHPDIPVETALRGAEAVRAVQARRRGDLRRLEAGPHQPQQAAGHGPRGAAVRPRHQRHALAYGEPVRLDRFIHPRVESEIAFLLARDIEGPPPSPRCWPRPRWSSARSTCSTRATRASSSRSPTSWPTTPAPGLLPRPDRPPARRARGPALLGAVVRVDGEVVMTGRGRGRHGPPAASVAYLANELAARARRPQGAGSWSSPAASPRRCPVRRGRQRHLRVRPARRHRGLRRLRGAARSARARIRLEPPERGGCVAHLHGGRAHGRGVALREAACCPTSAGRPGWSRSRATPRPACSVSRPVSAIVRPRADHLLLEASRRTTRRLAAVEDVLARHLERVGARPRADRHLAAGRR